MNNRKLAIITNIISIIVMIFSIITLLVLVDFKDSVRNMVHEEMAASDQSEKVAELEKKIDVMAQAQSTLKLPEKGETGDKGDKGDTIIGPTGATGAQGESIKGEQGDRGTDGKTPVKGVDYFDGKTPQIQCNVVKNRWEIRYADDEMWKLLNGYPVPCLAR